MLATNSTCDNVLHDFCTLDKEIDQDALMSLNDVLITPLLLKIGLCAKLLAKLTAFKDQVGYDASIKQKLNHCFCLAFGARNSFH